MRALRLFPDSEKSFANRLDDTLCSFEYIFGLRQPYL